MNGYRTLKAVNTTLGLISLGLGSYVISETDIVVIDPPAIDTIFMVVVAIGIVESIASLIVSCCINYVNQILDVIVRSVLSLALCAAGGLLVWSAFSVKDTCTINGYYYPCQPFEIKIAAGITCLINGICHGSSRRPGNVTPGAIFTSYPAGVAAAPAYPVRQAPQQTYQMQPAPMAPTIIQHSSSSYNMPSAPTPSSDIYQSTFQIPRFKVQNPTPKQYSNNYTQNQGGYQQNNDYNPNPQGGYQQSNDYNPNPQGGYQQNNDYNPNPPGFKYGGGNTTAPVTGGYQNNAYSSQSSPPFTSNYPQPQQHRY